MHWLVLYGVAKINIGQCMSPKPSLYMQSSSPVSMVLLGHCMSPKLSLYIHAEFRDCSLLVLGHCSYESKAFIIHAGFHAWHSSVWQTHPQMFYFDT